MACNIHIEDDFDLAKISRSGQCFRMNRLDDGSYRAIAGDKVLYICQLEDGSFDISCTEDEWRKFWHPYFDLDSSYSRVRQECAGKSDFIDTTIQYGKGLRILAQDPWEMLVTFIISQRKSMPAIATAVNALSERFGEPIDTGRETVYAFPTPSALAQATDDDLRKCSLGYRAPYVASAAQMVESGELDLEAAAELSNEDLFEELQRVRGVGAKVSNCVCLFGFGRTSQVPIDVWIARAIDEECGGEDPFEQFGDDAGIVQQYVFFYMTDRKRT